MKCASCPSARFPGCSDRFRIMENQFHWTIRGTRLLRRPGKLAYPPHCLRYRGSARVEGGMKSILEKYRFDGIWHFTDRSNLKLIGKHGLLSLAEAERRGVEIPSPGGNDWSHDADRTKGLDKFVHLAFVDDHPMLYYARREARILDPIWLKIKSSILLRKGVKFSSDVSNKSGVQILTTKEAEEQIDFDVLFTYMDWRDSDIQARRQMALKSEILVPCNIEVDCILGFRNG